jgi:hypothetical protein
VFLVLQNVAVPDVLVAAGTWARRDSERNGRQIEPHDDARNRAGEHHIKPHGYFSIRAVDHNCLYVSRVVWVVWLRSVGCAIQSRSIEDDSAHPLMLEARAYYYTTYSQNIFANSAFHYG